MKGGNVWRLRIVWRALIVSLALATAVAASGCGTGGDGPSYRVAVILQETPYEFWTSIRQGIDSAGEEFGVRFQQYVLAVGPVDKARQMESVRQAARDGVDAILLAPLPGPDMEQLIAETLAAGIPIVTVHTQIDVPGIVAVTQDHLRTAELAVQALEPLAAGARIAVVNRAAPELSLIRRQEAILERLAERAGPAAAVLLETTGDKLDVMQRVREMLAEQDDIAAIVGICEGCAVGAALAVRDLGLGEAVDVIGFDSSQSEIRLLEAGLIDAMIVQNPFAIGYQSVTATLALLGRKGPDADGPVSLQPFVVTRDSLQWPEHQKILYPFEGY